MFIDACRRYCNPLAFIALLVALCGYSDVANSEMATIKNGSNDTQSEQQQGLKEMPKRKFVGARAKDYRLALYIEAWRKRIELVGNLYYPKEASDRHLYGTVQVTVSIMKNGALEKVEINKSSGYKELDDAVFDIVKRAAPFAALSDDLKKEIDILSITRTWSFTHESVAVGDNWFIGEVEKQI